jgi:transcriptional regulator with XRE-family HTH domain
MEWKALRAHYERLFQQKRRSGDTQQSIANRGGIRQNDISRLLSQTDGLGPRVETFTKAIEGLGVPVSQFFAEIEKLQNARLRRANHAVENPPLPIPEAPHADSVPAGSPTQVLTRADIEHLARAFGEAVGRALRPERPRERAADRRLVRTRNSSDR